MRSVTANERCLRTGLRIACFLSVVCLPAGARKPAVEEVVKLDQQSTTVVPLNRSRISTVQAGETLREIPVVLEVSKYEITTARVGDSFTNAWGPRRIYCLTLRSTNPDVPYSWSRWTSDAFGLVRLTSNGDTTYLSWIGNGGMEFADVSRSNDRYERLKESLSPHRGDPAIVQVPVSLILPEVRTWGVNAHYFEITVRSIARDKGGNWVVRISGPASDQVFTLTSDRMAEAGWRLLESPVFHEPSGANVPAWPPAWL